MTGTAATVPPEGVRGGIELGTTLRAIPPVTATKPRGGTRARRAWRSAALNGDRGRSMSAERSGVRMRRHPGVVRSGATRRPSQGRPDGLPQAQSTPGGAGGGIKVYRPWPPKPGMARSSSQDGGIGVVRGWRGPCWPGRGCGVCSDGRAKCRGRDRPDHQASSACKGHGAPCWPASPWARGTSAEGRRGTAQAEVRFATCSQRAAPCAVATARSVQRRGGRTTYLLLPLLLRDWYLMQAASFFA